MGKRATEVIRKAASEESRHMTLDIIGASMGVTRERARQLEKSAMAKVKAGFLARGYTESDILDYLSSLGERSWVRFTD